MTQSGGSIMTDHESYRIDPGTAATRPPATPVADPVPVAGEASGGGVRLGLWGATGGGKTTYLAALRVAAQFGGWRMYGVSRRDSDFLYKAWRELYEQQRFPEATGLEPVTYRWLLHGDPPPSRFLRKSRPVRFTLRMQDVSGLAFRRDAESDEETREEARRQTLAHLAGSDGLVYLFDPLRDLTASRAERNVSYVEGVIERLGAMLGAAGKLDRDGRLTHGLAVCVSKFDDPAIFAQANAKGWVNFDPATGPMPRVLDEHAKAFFDEFICRELGIASADLLRRFITNHFRPERVGYFVTSSIGFYVKAGEFNEMDYSNVVSEDTSLRIRGDIRPINVLEPLVWLEQRVRSGWK